MKRDNLSLTSRSDTNHRIFHQSDNFVLSISLLFKKHLGHLMLIFFSPQVEFPEKDWLPEHLMYQLERLLPPREDVMITDEMEEVDLCEVDVRRQQRDYSREAYEEDEESSRGGVQCQTQ